MSATKWKKQLALLAGAILLAALAIGAAILFQSNDIDPAAQTNAPEAGGSSEPRKEAVAPDTPGGVAQEKEPSEISPRLAELLQILYDHRGDESNPKIRAWLEWYGNKMIADGKEDADIVGMLDSDLWSMRKISDPKELEWRIEDARKNALYEDEEDADEGWQYSENFSEKKNRLNKFFYDLYGDLRYPEPHEKTPREAIDILVEGMDDLDAAKSLIGGGYESLFPEASGLDWGKIEEEYAAEYADRVLAKDPTSRDALLVKVFAGVDVDESARLIIEHHSDDTDAIYQVSGRLWETSPELEIAAINTLLQEDNLPAESYFHDMLGRSYERLDMLSEAADQYLLAYMAGGYMTAYNTLERGERNYSSIWEERRPDAAAKQTPTAPSGPAHDHPHAAAPDDPHGAPPPPAHPDAPRPEGAPPPTPPNAEMDMAAAYADFAKAYQSAFEMEYSLSEATPEGYMNALLGMARAFAKSGDAQRAQDAYNAVRKRHSREEVEQVFRRFDEQERLKRQPPSGEDE